jgi:hypothetical protein
MLVDTQMDKRAGSIKQAPLRFARTPKRAGITIKVFLLVSHDSLLVTDEGVC